MADDFDDGRRWKDTAYLAQFDNAGCCIVM